MPRFGLLLLMGLAACGGGAAPSSSAGQGGPAVAVASPPVLGPTPTPTPSAPPKELLIPALKVDAVVESVGIDGTGRMGTPTEPSHVAWYNPGPVPGDFGDAVIDGHLDWYNGPAVFWHLAQLKVGDQITVVRSDGTQVVFVVDATRTYPADARDDALFAQVGAPTLTLVTCSGSWDRSRATYTTRLAVHANLAPTVLTQRPGDEGG